MAEQLPPDSTLLAIPESLYGRDELSVPAPNESPYYMTFYKMLHRFLLVAERAGDLRVYKDGDLTFGVRPGKFFNGDTEVAYTGATGQTLTNNTTNYIYLTAAGAIVTNTTGFPLPSATPHIPLAIIVTDAGDYAVSDITDYRGKAFLQVASSMSAANGNTLVGGGVADSLHIHDSSGIVDGAVTAAKILALAITEGKIASGAVTTTKLGDLAVATAKLAALAVTEEKIGTGAVTAPKIANGAFAGDATPQLGGNLDVNGFDLVSASNANIDILPNGTGGVRLCSTATVTGANAVAGGAAAASGQNALAIGAGNTVASGAHSAAFNNSYATGSYGFGIGSRADARLLGQFAQAAGSFGFEGSAQFARTIIHESTTDATPLELTTHTRYTIPDEFTCACTVTIAARQDTGANSAMYQRRVLIQRTGGTVALVGSVQTIGTDIETDAAWNVALSADDTNKSLKIEVTGGAAQNVNWVATIEAIEVWNSDA